MHGCPCRPALVAFLLFASPATAANLVVLDGETRNLQLVPDGRSLWGVQGRDVVRWTPNEGSIIVGQLPPQTIATAISSDGGTIVGKLVDWSGTQAFRWRPESGIEVLPKPNGYGYSSEPTFVSHDGSVIYGESAHYLETPWFDLLYLGLVEWRDIDFNEIYTFGITGVFRWDVEGGTQLVQDWMYPEGSNTFKSIGGISADGEVVGGSWDGTAVLWASDSGVVQSVSPTSPLRASVDVVSADGKTIAGELEAPFNTPEHNNIRFPFRRRSGFDFEPLTDLTGYSDIRAITTDGSTILGSMRSDAGDDFTFVWREGQGMQTLETYLIAHGVTLPPAQDHSANQMSDDGTVFRGFSTQVTTSPDGTVSYQTINWLADLTTAVPEPTPSLQFLSAILFVSATKRLRNRFAAQDW